MKYLDISANQIGSKGFMYFKVLFESNHTLRNLHVRKNQIGSEDELNQFPLCLKNNTHLRYLDLQDNNFSNEFGKNLLEILKNNFSVEDLEINGNNFIN